MLEVFHKAHVLHAGADAPGAGHAVAQLAFTGNVGIAVKGEVGEAVVIVVHAQAGHALGTVGRVAVVAGTVPAVQTGNAPIHLVFEEQGGQPALTVQAAVVILHGTVVEIPGNAEGIPHGHFAGQAGPPGGAVGIQLLVIKTAVLVTGSTHWEHPGGGILIGGTGHIEIVATVGVIILVVLLLRKGIRTDGGHHAPGGHFHAVKGQGQQQSENIHIVHVVGFIALVVAILIPAFEIIVKGASPQSGEAHVFVELVAGDHTGHVVIEHVAAGGHAGQGHALNAHAHLQVGLGHHPVDIGVLQLHHVVTVRAQRTTVLAVFAPGLGADFKEDRAGQGFRSHGIQLQAHALLGFEFVFAAFAFRTAVVAGQAVAAGELAVLARSTCLS